MNNRRKIGFRAYNDDAQDPEEDELKREQAERQKAIAEFIGHNYSPIGDTSQKCYKTSAELVYDIYPISLLSVRRNWPNNSVMLAIVWNI